MKQRSEHMSGRDGEPVTTLRGASVNADLRGVGRVAIAVCLTGLIAAIAVLFTSGANRNSRIDELHRHGVPVEATVSSCTGLMGGSGSNLVGYDCRADYTLDGNHYSEPLTGSAAPVPGTKIRAVAVPGDPALLTTAGTVAAEQASWRVFLLPTVLLLVLGAVLVALGLARRRAIRSRAGPRSS